jgi:hypothetical protein
MERAAFIDVRLWRAEAFDAVLGNDRWTCLTASVASDGSQLFAVYRMRLTGARRTVTLACDPSPSVGERRAAIRRRLGIGPVNEAGVPPSTPRETAAAWRPFKSRRFRPRRAEAVDLLKA